MSTVTTRSGLATGTFWSSRNENIRRSGPQARVPAGLMINGKTDGAWLPCQAATASADGAGVVAHAPAAEGEAADGAADGDAAPPPVHPASTTSKAVATASR